MKFILNKIKKEITKHHGDDVLADKTASFITERFTEYATVFGVSGEEVLEAIEGKRNYSAANYYQDANFPSLDEVRVFETEKEMRETIKTMQFRCPGCKGVSTNPYECNSGLEMEKGKKCDWKAYGLFRTMGEGLRFTIKNTFVEKPFIDEIFMPLDLEEQQTKG